MTDSGVDSELSPSSPDSVSDPPPPSSKITSSSEMVTGATAEDLMEKMEEDDEDTLRIDDGEDPADEKSAVAALLSLSESSRSPVSSPEKPMITILPGVPELGRKYFS